MPYFNKQTLNKLLKPTHNEEGSAFKVSYQSQGPAQLDKWMHFMEGRENCWRKREAVRTSASDIKLIVVGRASKCPPNSNELALMSGLISHYDVYPWQGENIPFSNGKAFSDSAEYWALCDELPIVNREEIERSLAKQGIATDQYIILDEHAYRALWKVPKLPIYESNETRTFLNLAKNDVIELSNFPFRNKKELNKIKALIKDSKFKSIKLPAISREEIKNLLQTIPDLADIKIEVENPSDNWIKNVLPELQGRNLHVQLSGRLPSKIAISSNLKFSKISIIDPDRVGKVKEIGVTSDGQDANGIQSLEVFCRALNKLNVESNSLSDVAIVEGNLKRLSLNAVPNIKHFEMKYSSIDQDFKFLDIECCPYIDSIKLEKVDALAQIILHPQAKLNELILDTCWEVSNLNWKQCKQLKKLFIDGANGSLPNLSDLTELEELELDDFDIATLDLSACKKLKKLTLKHCVAKDIKFANNSKLDQLSMQHCKMTSLDLLEQSSLKTISLTYANINQVTFPLANNLDFFRLNRCQIPNVDSIKNCETINKMELSGLKMKVIRIPNLVGKLLVQDCDDPMTIGAANIKKIELSESNHKMNLIVNPESIESLKIVDSGCNKLNIPSCKNIKNLELNDTSKFEDNFFSSLPRLEHLSISETKEINLSELGKCPKLKTMKWAGKRQTLNFPAMSSLESLQISSLAAIDGFDISQCQQLKKFLLNSTGGIKGDIDISGHEKLEEINIYTYGSFKRVKISKCPEVKYLKLTNAENVFLDNLPKLEGLEIGGADEAEIEGFQINNCHNLKRLSIGKHLLKKIDFSQFPHLEELTIAGWFLSDLDLSACGNLRILTIYQSDLQNLNVKNCKNLEVINIIRNIAEFNTPLSSIDMSDMPHLKHVSIECGDLGELNINLSGNPSLTKVKVVNEQHSNKTNLNIAGCINLSELYIEDANEVNLSGCEDCQSLHDISLQVVNPEPLLADFPASANVNLIKQDRPYKPDKPGRTAASFSNYPLPSTSHANEVNFEKLEQDYSQHQMNEMSPTTMVSLDDLDSEIKPDADTQKSNSKYQSKGSIFITLNSKEFVNRHHYRLRVLDEIECIGQEINFKKSINPNQLKFVDMKQFPINDAARSELETKLESTPNFQVGHFKGKLEKGVYYPLTSDHTIAPESLSEPFYCNPPDAVKIFWHEGHQQYYVQLNQEMPLDVEILYGVKVNPYYEDTYHGNLIVDRVNQLIPKTLSTALQQLKTNLKADHPLQFIFSDLPLDEKLEKLVMYVKEYTNESLNTIPAPGIDTLLQCIIERKGACRHRAESFMVLARYLGIPARMICNEQHALCEIAYQGAPTKWFNLDFGGAPTLDLTPNRNQYNLFQNPVPKTNVTQQSPQQTVQQQDTKPAPIGLFEQHTEIDPAQLEKEKWLKEYNEIFTKLAAQNEFKTMDDLLNQTLPPLLELNQNQDPFTVNARIVETLKNIDHYVYINSPTDFLAYLKPYCLENGVRKQLDGPLINILREGGTVLVNWSTFSPTEIASYKSILDNPPTLLGIPFEKSKVKVIGLAKTGVESCAAFLSRCQHFKVSNEFLTPIQTPVVEVKAEAEKAEEKVAEPMIADLYNSLNWRERLLGKISFKGEYIILEDGPLIKAIKEGRPLEIENPPEDDDFLALVHRVNEEKRIIYNGQVIAVPKAVTILTYPMYHVDQLEGIVDVDVSGKRPKDKKPIYLGLYNIHECYEQLEINKQQQASAIPGLIDQYDPDQNFFYLTESISQSDWQELLDYIQTKYSDKHFNFVLADGVSIDKVAFNQNPVKPDKELTASSNVVVSDDPDFYISKMKQDAIVVDVTPQTGFTDLIAEIKIEPNKNDPNKTEFSYIEKDILRALHAGKNVILNGTLSPALYQQLLPILNEKPAYFVSNDKTMKLQGQLTVVMPKQALAQLPMISYTQQNYHMADYKNEFSNNQDAPYFEQLESFYKFLHILPHRGMGRPESPTLSQHLLRRMITKLQASVAKLHVHNPMKGLLNYDYPKDSEDYAYLNVMAKYIMRGDDKAQPRFARLQTLLMNNHITQDNLKNYAWRILNCFRGAELKQILGTELNHLLDERTIFPTLTSNQLDNLWRHVNSIRQQQSLTTKKPHVEKRSEQLNILLHDPETPIILLKGAAGVGKTHTVKHLQETLGFKYYEGETSILKWLTDSSDDPKVLLLDEANMQQPGTYDFLKGICRGPQRIVYYQGKEYVLKASHKIIATGNPETYPERYYHPLFQHYGETILFSMPEDDYLEKQIIKIRLESDGYYKPEYSAALLAGFNLARDFNPTFVFSNRDLENVVQRFIVLMKDNEHEQQSSPQLLWHAIVGEFAGIIQETEKRERYMTNIAEMLKTTNPFKEKIKQEGGVAPMITISDNCRIPNEKAHLVAGIEQDLKLRSHAVKSKDSYYYKQGILLEGNVGLGKSTLLKTILEQNGFSQASDTLGQKKYYEISVGNEKEVRDVLIKAFHEGSVVILDELNLDESLEELLNQLLTGTYQDKEAANKGFMVFASQNPSYFVGRKSVSSALCNRMTMRYMEDYTPAALLQIAKDRGIAEPEVFVESYLINQKKYGSALNMRTFYTALESAKPAMEFKM